MAPADGRTLFIERARAVDATFEEDEHVVAICHAVDELPLAIELAAARVRSLSTQTIRQRLAEGPGLLATRDRDVDSRQRTLEATIAWSYDLLAKHERNVLRGLSVFAGGCTLAAAERVAGADVDTLEALLDKSLIRHRSDETGQDRYWMLETIREYALRELERSGQAHDVGSRHTEFFLGLAAGLMAPVSRGLSDEQRDVFVRDRASLHEAHARALATGDGASAVRFVRCLRRAMSTMGAETSDWHSKQLASLALPGGTGEDRAYALLSAAGFAALGGDIARARRLLDEADALFDALGDERGVAEAVALRCDVEIRAGDFGEGVALAERLATIGEALDDAGLA